MIIAYIDTDKLAELISPAKLAAQGFLKPLRVTVTYGPDHNGDNDISVLIVVPDDTPDAKLTYKKLLPMMEWIRLTFGKALPHEPGPIVQVVCEFQLKGVRY